MNISDIILEIERSLEANAPETLDEDRIQEYCEGAMVAIAAIRKALELADCGDLGKAWISVQEADGSFGGAYSGAVRIARDAITQAALDSTVAYCDGKGVWTCSICGDESSGSSASYRWLLDE